MAADWARPLALRYVLGLAGLALPLLLLVAGLATTQFKRERESQLELIARDLGDLRMVLDARVKPAADHVQQLRQVAEDRLARRIPTPASPLRDQLRLERWEFDGVSSEGVLLRGVAGSPMERLIGNLHGRADLLVQRGAAALELDMALGLFELTRPPS